MLGLCDPSNLLFEYSFYPLRSDALFSRLNFAVVQFNDELCVEKVMKMLRCNAVSNRMERADGSRTLVLVLSH